LELLIVDDHDAVRASMRDMLSVDPDLRIIAEAANGREAVELCRRVRPDLVLMDVRMPRMDGLKATRAIKQENPRTSVLMVTMHENPNFLLEALDAGAAGYVLKDASADQLIDIVRKTLNGESPLDQELAARLLRRLVDERKRDLASEPLKPRQTPRGVRRSAEEALPEPRHAEVPQPVTTREIEVLELMALGRTNREIAQAFVISPGTAKRHVENIIAKLGVSDRTQAAIRALELGIIPFPES
jgi:DNA-binding NarL/FixJ family response regulator